MKLVSVNKHTLFLRAFALQNYNMNCYPPPDVVLFKLLLPRLFLSGGVLFRRHRYDRLIHGMAWCVCMTFHGIGNVLWYDTTWHDTCLYDVMLYELLWCDVRWYYVISYIWYGICMYLSLSLSISLSLSLPLPLSLSLYIYMYIHICVYIHIYIYREREMHIRIYMGRSMLFRQLNLCVDLVVRTYATRVKLLLRGEPRS